jgi:hypothetical protein
MALTFEHCRSCGGKIQVDLKVPAEDRRCMLCGEPCSRQDEMELPDETAEPVPPTVESLAGEAHKPVEFVQTYCPNCRAPIAVDPHIPVEKQHCHACGLPFVEPPKKGRVRKQSEVTPDGLLKGTFRERVWMPMVGTLLMVVLAAIFGLWMNSRKEPVTAEETPLGPQDNREQLGELVTAFMAAKTPEEMRPLLRDPEKSEPILKAWLSTRPNALPIGGEIVKVGYPREIPGTRVANVIVTLPAGLKKPVLAVETSAGFKVDWRAYSETGDMSVEQFLAQKPATPTLLIAAVRRSDYYNHAYQDKTAWECLKVSAGNGDHAFYAYVPRHSTALMNALVPLPPLPAKRGQKATDLSRPMALRACVLQPGVGDTLQAEVESVIGDGWYVP